MFEILVEHNLQCYKTFSDRFLSKKSSACRKQNDSFTNILRLTNDSMLDTTNFFFQENNILCGHLLHMLNI